MKKHVLLILSVSFLLLLNSCKKQDLKTESISSPPSGDPVKRDKQSGRAARAGDGLLDVLGWGYDATMEYANSNSVGFQVVDVDAFKAANPDRLIEEFPLTQEYREDYGADAAAYSAKISSQVNIGVSPPGLKLFDSILKIGFSSSLLSNRHFDGKYIYSSYNLTIKQKRVRINSDLATLQNYVKQSFIDDVNGYYNDPWTLVKKYGTHVLLDVYTGAKMDILFQSETTNSDREMAARIGIKAGVKNIFDLDISNDVSTQQSYQNFSRKLYYRTRGGNPALGLVGTLNLDNTNSPISFAAWQSSSTVANSVMVDIGPYGIALIYDFIADPVKKAAVKAFVDQYLINRQAQVDHLSVPVHRYYNPILHDHYYTIVQDPPSQWYYENVEFNAYAYQAPGTVPVYRYWGNGNDHFYTISTVHPGPNYAAEGAKFYAYSYQAPGTVPIYRYWNNGQKDHFYTRVFGNYSGYVYEKIEFYAY